MSFVVAQRVEDVGTGQVVGVDLRGARVVRVAAPRGFVVIAHDATPISSRRRIMPSRNLVLTVPIGTPSIAATSLWL